jgi:hypothetical protein
LKKDLNSKYRRGPLPLRSAQLSASLGPIQRAKPAAPSVFLGTLSSGPQRLTDPTHQPLYFAGRNRFAPDPLRRSVPSQTRPLPLLAHMATPAELPSMSQPPVTTSRLKAVRVCACPPEPSCRLWCAVTSHRCCCSATARRCSSRGAHARSSATKSSSRPLRWPSCHGRKHTV